jgi:hypothetical protein
MRHGLPQSSLRESAAACQLVDRLETCQGFLEVRTNRRYTISDGGKEGTIGPSAGLLPGRR